MNTFSASLLVKQSASQIFYLRSQDKKRKTFKKGEPSSFQISGNDYAASRCKSKYIEMQGIFNKPYAKIYFSFDEVRKIGNKLILIEYKLYDSFEEPVPDWFIENSLIQTALQGSLLEADLYRYSEVELNTASYVKADCLTLKVSKETKLVSKLDINKKVHKVTYNPFPILQFYMTKARASLKYETAKKFDNAYKHKEWSYLKNFIAISKG